MAGALRRIHERHDAEPARPLTQLSHRIHRPKRVRDVHHREQFDLLRQKGIEIAQVKQPFVAGHRQINQLCPGSLRQQLPRHLVAVMLHLRQQDFVARLQVLTAPRGSHEVDAFGRAAREHDLVGAPGVDELCRSGASGFIARRRAIAQFVNAPMHVRVVAFVVIAQRVNHRARFLARRRVVEINQRMPVDLLVQNRKVCAQ